MRAMTSSSGRRQTRVLAADDAGIAEAAALLRAGGWSRSRPKRSTASVRMPLSRRRCGASSRPNAGQPTTRSSCISRALDQIDRVAKSNAVSLRLGAQFWPGPLTLVLPKQPSVPAEVTAGLQTVAVRVPDHAVAQALLLAAGMPLAAPSANLFGRPSPTRAAHVLEDLDGRIDAVLDGGPTTVGVESTIVDVSRVPPRLLRPGGLAAEAIEAVLGERLVRLSPAYTAGPQTAPGLMPVHYSPRTPLTLVIGAQAAAQARLRTEVEAAVVAGQRVGVLALEEDVSSGRWSVVSGQKLTGQCTRRGVSARGRALSRATFRRDPRPRRGRS